MYAFYEFVSNAKEKQDRLGQIRDLSFEDSDYYSSYLEIAAKYDAPMRELSALKALNAAIRKGKVQTVVIASFENLYMAEAHAYNLLLRFMRKGIRIAVRNPYNIQTEEDLFEMCCDAQMECIATVLSIPMITMQDCRIHCSNGTPFIRLLEDCTQEDYRWYPTQMLYADAVEKYRKTGFFFYRSDVSSWYHVPDCMAEQMIEFYNIAYQTLFESIGLDTLDFFS